MAPITEAEATVEKRFSINLDTKAPISSAEFEVVEGDTRNYIEITLTDSGAEFDLTNCRVVAVFAHSGGTSMQDSAESGGGISLSGNVMTLHLHTEACCAGYVECELQIYGTDPSGYITTAKFSFTCRKPMLSDATTLADMNFSVFSGLISQANTALASAQAIPRMFIRYCARNPATYTDEQLSETPDSFIGIALTAENTAPEDLNAYSWFCWKGERGVGVSSAAFNSDSELILTLTDSGTLNAGTLSGLSDMSGSISALSGALAGKADTSAITTISSTMQPKNMYFADVAVAPSLFEADNTHPQYPFRARIACQNVTSSMFATVIFNVSEATSGNFAPICGTSDGYVSIFAHELPESTFTIAMIKVES